MRGPSLRSKRFRGVNGQMPKTPFFALCSTETLATQARESPNPKILFSVKQFQNLKHRIVLFSASVKDLVKTPQSSGCQL